MPNEIPAKTGEDEAKKEDQHKIGIQAKGVKIYEKKESDQRFKQRLFVSRRTCTRDLPASMNKIYCISFSMTWNPTQPMMDNQIFY